MANDLLVNDVPALTLGLTVSDIAGSLDAPPHQYQSVVVPGREGETEVADPRETPRSIAVRGLLRGTSGSNVRTKIDALKLAFQGNVKLGMPDGKARHIYAKLDTFTAPVVAGQFSAPVRDLPVEIRLTARRPYFLDDTPTSVVSPGALPLGTGLVRPTMSLTGATVTGVTFTLKNYLAATVATMSFPTLSLVGGDTLVIDCDAMTAKKNGTNVLDLLDVTSDFFLIDPAVHALYGTSSWPTITVNAGVNTTTYSKAWR